MLAHIAGAPVEELVPYIAMNCAGALVAIRVWFGRWWPRRARRHPATSGGTISEPAADGTGSG